MVSGWVIQLVSDVAGWFLNFIDQVTCSLA